MRRLLTAQLIMITHIKAISTNVCILMLMAARATNSIPFLMCPVGRFLQMQWYLWWKITFHVLLPEGKEIYYATSIHPWFMIFECFIWSINESMIDELMNLRCVKWILHVKELGSTVPISRARWRKRRYIKDFCKHTRVKLGQYFRYGNRGTVRIWAEYEKRAL